MKLRIAVHKSCKNKQSKPARDWQNILEDLDWLLGWVQNGYGWCATHFQARHRKADNSAGSNMVVIDFDGDTTLARFWSTDTARHWCAATYTSASHSETEHRFRALFPLGKELRSTAEHKGAYWLIVNRLLAELKLNELADNCGQKPERLWFGNTKADIKKNVEFEPVPDFLLNDIAYEETSNFVSSDVTELDVKRAQWLLESFLVPSDDGEYETYYVPVMAACAGIGQPVFDSWVEWVLKGHHGEKRENIQAFKWRGLGTYSGPTTLYSLAKKQDPDWAHKLPPHLRFGAVGAAAGYTEFDPVPDIDQILETHLKQKGSKKSMSNNDDNIVPEPLPDSDQVKKRGRPKKTDDDLAKQRESDVEKVKEILSNLRKNELTGAIEYTQRSGEVIFLQGQDLDLMTTKLACENGVFIPEQRIKSAIQYAASKNRYCPIRSYLDHCSENAEPFEGWDRVGETFLGNSQPLATMTMQRLMIGAVARAYDPGCTMSWLPILVGPQGAGKSMFARSLVPQTLFAEITTPLDTLMREQYRLHVAWLLELPEIDNYFNSKNIENFKNLVTTRLDEVRYPYASLPSKLPRRFVFIGTTNRNQFLVDSTGNRRFVPLELGAGFQIPWQELRDCRDSLWASAVAAYRNHESHEFTSGEIADIFEYIQEFGDPDPWLDKIASYVAIREEVRTADVLTNALELDPRSQGRRESRRVADVLQSMGWRRLVTSRQDPNGKSKSVRVWQRPKNDPLSESHILNDF
jgi:predicted P-loop ATPase